ncbi:rod shape-determining protein MreC [Candidatus Pelagibacter sp. HIMB1321]|uniref:rod shape-determining protein MreC n=1 Tax=Candidatus Pelagibacter sp. HIMB1321 TaxID=1388755 RepID=UPI000A0804A5|nr:rod shape-determining protein MreC [Candidatus Pelagibacter sp. HIMB1321]SMF78643.1 rod shape-determining protein MreC [Candidatus Pelagibacter sp. HIMB1321]
MASSRDDFVIAFRSAFLRKETKQKFSLLTLLFVSILIIVSSNLNFKIIKDLKSIINEAVYRSSFIVSVPENLIKNYYLKINEYSNFYEEYLRIKKETKNFETKEILNEIIINENEELKKLIEDFTFTKNKILAKVIVDHDSPFSKTIIINKGSKDGLKIGTNIFDRNYLIGRVIETNFKTSRVLLLSDLNSNVPISIVPGDIQAIVVGDGIDSGKIKYIKNNLIEEIQDQSIGYTSGTGALFRSGVPVGRVSFNQNEFFVNFYSDFSQLKYVLVEVETKTNNIVLDNDTEVNVDATQNEETIKINILNDQINILNETNKKFIEENTELASQNKNLLIHNNKLEDKIKKQTKEINQNKLDQEEFEFLRLNLLYSAKCQKTIFKKGYKVGTPEYKNCILKRGRE